MRTTCGWRSISDSQGRSGWRRFSSSVRYVPTTASRSLRALRARNIRTSRVESSAQCRSSTTSRTGMRSPSDRSSASSPSKMRAWTHPGRSNTPGSAVVDGPSSGRSRPRSLVSVERQLVDVADRAGPPASMIDGSRRSASTIGANGSPSPLPSETQPPSSTNVPAARALSATSSTRRVLPMPASPPTRTTVASPAVPRRTASLSDSSSTRRPMNSGLATRVATAPMVAAALRPSRSVGEVVRPSPRSRPGGGAA